VSRSLSYYLMHPLQQWKSGLLDCLPAGLRNRLAPVVEPYVLELGDTQARLYRSHEGNKKQLGVLDAQESRVDAGLASALNSRQAPLLLLLPPVWVLRRQITLPAAAQENLGQVIRFEMDRLTPFAADQVYYDHKVEQESSADELIPISIALVPRKKIASWLSLLDGVGIRPDKISAEGLWPEANFLPQEARPGTDMKRAALKMLPGGVVAVLLLVAMALPLWQKHNVARAMKIKEVPLKKQANEVISIREQLQAERERQQQLHTTWTQYPPAVDVLKVLTDLLPDDTSLQQMDINGIQLILRGKSGQASSLIKLLEESSGFSDVKFMSSVVQQRGKEQFHLSANIVMPFVQIIGEDLVEPVIDDTPSTPVAASQDSTASSAIAADVTDTNAGTAGDAGDAGDAGGLSSALEFTPASTDSVSESTVPPMEPVRHLGSAPVALPADAPSRSVRMISGAGG
jgi:general secretion pathway protein L